MPLTGKSSRTQGDDKMVEKRDKCYKGVLQGREENQNCSFLGYVIL